MNQSRWTSIASFAAIVVAGFTSLGACAGTTESTDSTQTAAALSAADESTTTDADASTTTTTDGDAGKSCEGKKK